MNWLLVRKDFAVRISDVIAQEMNDVNVSAQTSTVYPELGLTYRIDLVRGRDLVVIFVAIGQYDIAEQQDEIRSAVLPQSLNLQEREYVFCRLHGIAMDQTFDNVNESAYCLIQALVRGRWFGLGKSNSVYRDLCHVVTRHGGTIES